MKHDLDPKRLGPNGDAMVGAISTCIHCGFCLSACPTYQELGTEVDSPRGRIVLMKEVLEGALPVEDAAPHIDACLGCLACEPACPSGVPYRDLISPFRAETESRRKRTFGDRLRRMITRMTLPYPTRFRLAMVTGRLAKPLSGLMPKSLRPMLSMVPDSLPPKQVLQTRYPASGEMRGRVALLSGCAQSVLDPDINAATIDVLTRNGIEVIVPSSQGCCGSLSWHVGDKRNAQTFAIKALEAFDIEADAIITNAAGCGSGMQEYGHILAGTDHQAKAESFSKRVIDVSAYLATMGLVAKFPESTTTIRVAYHDACHLASAQGVRSQPRDLLGQIPGVEVLEVAEPHLCCGSAGTYNVDQPEIADALGQNKATNIIATAADIVAAGNIGCTNQIAHHLRNQSSTIQVRHTMQILRDAYAGKIPGQRE